MDDALEIPPGRRYVRQYVVHFPDRFRLHLGADPRRSQGPWGEPYRPPAAIGSAIVNASPLTVRLIVGIAEQHGQRTGTRNVDGLSLPTHVIKQASTRRIEASVRIPRNTIIGYAAARSGFTGRLTHGLGSTAADVRAQHLRCRPVRRQAASPRPPRRRQAPLLPWPARTPRSRWNYRPQREAVAARHRRVYERHHGNDHDGDDPRSGRRLTPGLRRSATTGGMAWERVRP